MRPAQGRNVIADYNNFKNYKYDRNNHDDIPSITATTLNPFEYNLRDTNSIINIVGENVPRVIVDLSLIDKISTGTLSELGYTYFKDDDKWGISDFACDYIFTGKKNIDFEIPGTLGVIQNYSVWKENKKERVFYACVCPHIGESTPKTLY